MSLVVNHNLMAQNAARNLTSVFSSLGSSVEKLSSGLRVVSASDDAAGMAIRELMRSDIAVLNQGVRNASDAISMIQTAEGAMSVIDEKLIRMKELAEQAATGTYTTVQREIMNSEYQAMAAEIDRIATATDFNGVKLLDGSMAALHQGSGLKVHFGTGNSSSEDYYYINIGDMRATQGTGLRVGNNDTRDTWTTTGLNMTSADDIFGLQSHIGGFGLQYTHDGGGNWNTYGYVTVDERSDTLSSIVQEINQGAQSTMQVNFASGTIGDYDNKNVTINGHVFTFDTTTSVSTDSVVGIAGLTSATSIATTFSSAINLNNFGLSNTVNAVASVSGTTVTLYHGDFGTPTGDASLGTDFGGSSTLNMAASWTATTGDHLDAAAVQQDAYGYELQLTSNQAGNSHQIRIVTSDGSIIDFGSSGVTITTGGPVLYLDGGGSTLNPLPEVDNASEWAQTVNGTGNTTWTAKDILTQSAAQIALAGLDDAINTKDQARANLGAMQNRLENTITNLQIQAENLQAAESRISDVDVATEMTSFTRNNILAQAAVSMLAQANSLPSLALSLLS